MDRLLKQFGVRRQEAKSRSSCNLCKSCDDLLSVTSRKGDFSPCSPVSVDLTAHLPVRVVQNDLTRKMSSEKVPPLAKAKRVIGALTSKNLPNMHSMEAHLVDLCERARMFGVVEEDNELYRSNSFRFQKGRQKNIVKKKSEVSVEENYAFPLDLVVKRKPLVPVRTISIQRDRKVRVTEAYEDPSDSKYYCEPGEDRLAKIYGDTHYSQPYLEALKFNRTGRKDANDNAYEDISTSYDYDSKDRLVTRIRINKPAVEEQETLIDLVYDDEYIEDRLSDFALEREYDNELYFSHTVPEYAKVDAKHLKKKRIDKHKRFSVACDENFDTNGTLRKSAFDQVHKLNIPVGDEYSTLLKNKALSSCPTLIDDPYYECVIAGGDSLPLLDDICQTLTAKEGLDYDLRRQLSTMRRKQVYETAFDSRVRNDSQSRSDEQGLTPDNENRNSILRRFWKSKNRINKLSPSDMKVDSESQKNDNYKIPRSRRIDNFTEEKGSETSVTKNELDTTSLLSMPLTPPSSVPLVPKFKKSSATPDSNPRSVSPLERQIENLHIDNCTCPPNKNTTKTRYASSDSMASSSTMSSLESLRSSTSESARSTSSSLSSHSSDDQSKKRQSLSLDLPSRAQPRPNKASMTLNAKKFQQMLSPISDKSQDVSSENKGSTTSPDDSDRTKTEEIIPAETEPPKKPCRKSLSLQLSAGNYPYVTVQSDHASDSGISLGPTRDEQGCEDVPFPMPKLRKRSQIRTVMPTGSSSAKSSPVEELPFPMPKLRRRPNSMVSTRETCPLPMKTQISPENGTVLFPMPKLRRKPNVTADCRNENKNSLVLNFNNPIGGEKLTNLKLELNKSNRSSLSLDIGSVASNRPRNRSSLTLDFSSSMNIMGEPVDPTIPLDKQTWFHGAITRVEAENILRSKPSGSYLVRNSESSRNEYSLSLKSARGFMHMRIQRTSVTQNIGPCDISVEHFVLGQFSKPFQTIPEMIRHYSVNKLPIKGAEHMCLLYPVIDQCL